MPMQATRTTCPYCGTGCGILAEANADGSIALRGDPDHPANFGRLCSKGAALDETLDLDTRLLHPQVGGRRVSWETALDTVADGFRRVIDQHGPDAVAFYLSGQLLTEDYYIANKLMKGYIGSANVDTNSRLCMASAVAGYKRAFGEDLVPCNYEDIERAKLLVFVGSNAAWCHPVLFQRAVAAKERHPDLQVVVIDPRRTATCELADLHLALRPGSDGWLFNGLLAYLNACDEVDRDFVTAHTQGFGDALAAAQCSAPDIASVAQQCDLPVDQVERFFRLFARTERVVTLYSQGVNQSSSGSDKNNAIINVHLATGRLGRPGMGPFSLTGQPNAMGGREAGGLANQLAAHMDFGDEECDRVQRFWNSPTIVRRPGLKAVDLFDAMADGRVKAVWIMATNPLVSLPDSARMQHALAQCDLVVVSDCVADNETLRHAHVRLPALAWGEKDGTVTNSERRLSRQRAFLPPPGEARADWWMIDEVARRLGYGAAFEYANAASIFSEHAALSTFENAGQRHFDLGGLTALTPSDYEALTPVQWPVTTHAPEGTARLFTNRRFAHADGRARFIPIVPKSAVHPADGKHTFRLNTGRSRDHWHTLTRSGLSPRLAHHDPEPALTVHPQDAQALGLQIDGFARIEGAASSALMRVHTDVHQRRGEIFAPMHWSGPYAAQARVNAVVPACTDPISGQPESKHATVTITPWAPEWQGFVLTRKPLALPFAQWSRRRGQGVWRYDFAGVAPVQGWREWAHALCAASEWMELVDRDRFRTIGLIDGHIETVLFATTAGPLPASDWLEEMFACTTVSESQRHRLLLGRDNVIAVPQGRMVCACKGVTETAIHAAIREGVQSVAALGEQLAAGTGCGSCIPELRALLTQTNKSPPQRP